MPTGNLCALTTLGQLVQRIGPNCLEQSPTAERFRCIERYERLGDQACDALGNHGGRHGGTAHDRGRRFEREPAGANRHPAQQDPFGLRQQLVAPIERRTQGLVFSAEPFDGRLSGD